ncbi:LppU/SCO3897 family protein [Actinoallomurus sp. CA-150999]|uniref:LppU/SCO3897 family protein n=1 Tax=Actinoallomurus sp. CA-150999 TaxID=3239887 RepID=UPI003D89F7C2
MPPPGMPGPGMPPGPPGAYGGPPGPYGPPPGLAPDQRRKRLLIVLPIALVALVGIIVINRLSSGSDEAAVGDCVKKTSDQTTSSGKHITGDNIKTVACTDASATYKVVGKVQHVSRISVSIEEMNGGKGACSPYPSATVRYWRGKTSGDGYVLCLAPNQH